MRHRHCLRWSLCVVAAIGVSVGFGGSTVMAGDLLHHQQNYDVVQGYIMQGQCQANVGCQAQAPSAPVASAQNQSVSLGIAPAPVQQPTVTLQLTPAPAPVQTFQLSTAPAPVQTLQLTAAPAAVQTLQLSVAPAPVQTLAVTPVHVQYLQLAAPPQVQTLQLAPQHTVTPVTLLLPSHRCHWFCRHKN